MKLWDGKLLLFLSTSDICHQFLNQASFFMYILGAVEHGQSCWGVKKLKCYPQNIRFGHQLMSPKSMKEKEKKKTLPV